MFRSKNCQGNIGIAIVIVLIAVLSGVSFASLAFSDTVRFRLQLDGIQQFHILRSEVGRGRLMASHFENVPTPPIQTVLPTRSVPVEFGDHRTVYNARTKLDMFDYDDDTGYHIRSLITGIRGDGGLLDRANLSPVKRYGENRILSMQTIALFHYFTDVDRSINDRRGGIRFVGQDIIHGRVHSNTEIHINYTSAGAWPQFYGLVTTAGKMLVEPGSHGNFPEEEIFFGGLIEDYPVIEFEPSAERVRTEGIHFQGGLERDDALAFVTVDGSYYEIILGEVVTEDPAEWIEGHNKFTIYSSYPPYGPVGNEIGVNYIPKTDTLWATPVGGNLINNSMFVPMELWISGEFGGRQTWASSHHIYLKDDLTYTNTPKGQRPDGYDSNNEQTLPVNRTDYLGIISEESIYIQYGHKDPEDSVRYKPNTQDIYMYGAYAAVGDEPEPWYDGMFTFQYYHPKGSTPAQYWRGEFFKNIDLHMFHYPTTAMNPWPRGLDYPWYNPIWPEPGPLVNVPGFPASTPNPHNAEEVFIGPRGTIYIFGSIAQRRRGPVGTNLYSGIWDIDNAINPDTYPTYGAMSPERVTHAKAYTTDLRFERTGPPHYPIIRFEGYESEELRDLGYATLGWVFKSPPENF